MQQSAFPGAAGGGLRGDEATGPAAAGIRTLQRGGPRTSRCFSLPRGGWGGSSRRGLSGLPGRSRGWVWERRGQFSQLAFFHKELKRLDRFGR